MKKRFSDEQIISILREAEAEVSARELCRKHAISDATFYTCRIAVYNRRGNSRGRQVDVALMNRLLQLAVTLLLFRCFSLRAFVQLLEITFSSQALYFLAARLFFCSAAALITGSLLC
ncbi:transposase [Pantoea agglomerans]|uniref:transposase n=1 Tax=Enterobacter agglomerans TaxID=549 RepID=UPI003C7C4B25